MGTNESLRQRALRLIKHGISQKVLAGKMGMAPSTFSKWLNRKRGIGPASVVALDGFNDYERELQETLAEHPPLHVVTQQDETGTTVTNVQRPVIAPDAQQANPVSGTKDPTVRRMATKLLGLPGEAERAGQVEKPARSARAVGQHAATPGPAPARRRVSTRKHR